jgi:hypothetical protein
VQGTVEMQGLSRFAALHTSNETKSSGPICSTWPGKGPMILIMGLPGSVMRRLLAAAAMIGAFVLMASIFSPDRSKATVEKIADPTVYGDDSTDPHSTDPHKGLPSLGSIEGVHYSVRAYGTAHGPRYSVFDVRSNRAVGVLLTMQDVERYFPEVHLDGLKFDVPNDAPEQSRTLMLAEPHDPLSP